MRTIRYSDNGTAVYALVEGDRAYPLKGEPWPTPSPASGNGVALERLPLLAPCAPSKIIGIGKNYRSRSAEPAVEPTEPMLFLKPPTTIVGPGASILRPLKFTNVVFEGELAVVIGRTAHNVPRERALEYVFGYTCFNDVTVRDVIKRDVQLTRSKSFDTSGPMGPAIVTNLDPATLEVITRVNGQVVQQDVTRNLIFDVPTLIAFVSDVMTLCPGDVIATGTPAGSTNMNVGDVVEVEIPSIGILSNLCSSVD